MKKLGTIDAVMVDTKSEKNVYAMLKLLDDIYPMPIPLKAIREAETGLVLNASREQLMQRSESGRPHQVSRFRAFWAGNR